MDVDGDGKSDVVLGPDTAGTGPWMRSTSRLVHGPGRPAHRQVRELQQYTTNVATR